MSVRALLMVAAWLVIASGVAELADRWDVLAEMGLEARRSIETVCCLDRVLL